MGPAPQFGVPALDAFTSAPAEAAAPVAASQADCTLAWPPPQEEIDSIEVIELHVDELQTRVVPRRELVLVSTPAAATAHVAAVPAAVVPAQPTTAGPDVARLNAQIRDLLRFIGRRPEDHPDAFIPVPVAPTTTVRLQPRA
ncbi:MAG: hypothetical protein AB7I50_00350 [Vicinamibacterales bacterium]